MSRIVPFRTIEFVRERVVREFGNLHCLDFLEDRYGSPYELRRLPFDCESVKVYVGFYDANGNCVADLIKYEDGICDLSICGEDDLPDLQLPAVVRALVQRRILFLRRLAA